MANLGGTVTTLNAEQRTGMNVRLKAVGLPYDVTKFVGDDTDKPRWSSIGR